MDPHALPSLLVPWLDHWRSCPAHSPHFSSLSPLLPSSMPTLAALTTALEKPAEIVLCLSLSPEQNLHDLHFVILFWLFNNVVLVSGIQQSDSAIYIHASTLFQIIFPFRLLQNIEQHFCAILGPCWLSKYSSVYMSIANSQFIPAPTYPLVAMLVFYIHDSTSVLYISSFVPF